MGTAQDVEILGSQSGSFSGQLRVFVEWPTRRPTASDASILIQNGQIGGNSGNIPRRWLRACEQAALVEWQAQHAA